MRMRSCVIYGSSPKLNLKGHWECPCGSGEKIRRCCRARIEDLRDKIAPVVARKALETVGARTPPVVRS
jgi:uncharacterized protein YchJ